jgi:hypothetical protein
MSQFNGRNVTILGFVLLLFAFLFPPLHLFTNAGPMRQFDYALCLVALLLVAGGLSLLVSQGRTFWAFLKSSRNAYSLSQFQMACWTWLVFGAFFAAAFCNIWSIGDTAASAGTALNIQINNNLLAMIGISGFSLAATPAILALRSQTPATDTQVDAAQQRLGGDQDITANGQVVIRTDPTQAALSDIVKGDELANAGTVDLGKLQNLMLTMALLAAYVKLTLDAISTTHLITELPFFGDGTINLLLLSHAGYLIYKAAPKPDAGAAQPSTPTLPPARPINVADPRQGVG